MNNETTYNSCPICSARIKEWRIKTVNLERYKIDICNNCYFRYMIYRIFIILEFKLQEVALEILI